MNRYQRTDKFIEKLKKKIRQEFNYLLVTGFDELNVVTTAKKTKAQYKRLLDLNDREYHEIGKEAVSTAQGLLTASERAKGKVDSDDIVEEVLLAYNAVTGYLYEPEAERKRLRQAEEMMTAVTYQDRGMYEKALKRCANLWAGQSTQYAIDVVDTTYIRQFKKAGIEKVMWVTRKDEKVCEECRPLDGKIFPIDQVPRKKHPNCRCILVPVRDKK